MALTESLYSWNAKRAECSGVDERESQSRSILKPEEAEHKHVCSPRKTPRDPRLSGPVPTSLTLLSSQTRLPRAFEPKSYTERIQPLAAR